MCESRNFVILQVYGSSYAELGIILQCTYIAIYIALVNSLLLYPLQHYNIATAMRINVMEQVVVFASDRPSAH